MLVTVRRQALLGPSAGARRVDEKWVGAVRIYLDQAIHDGVVVGEDRHDAPAVGRPADTRRIAVVRQAELRQGVVRKPIDVRPVRLRNVDLGRMAEVRDCVQPGEPSTVGGPGRGAQERRRVDPVLVGRVDIDRS